MARAEIPLLQLCRRAGFVPSYLYVSSGKIFQFLLLSPSTATGLCPGPAFKAYLFGWRRMWWSRSSHFNQELCGWRTYRGRRHHPAAVPTLCLLLLFRSEWEEQTSMSMFHIPGQGSNNFLCFYKTNFFWSSYFGKFLTSFFLFSSHFSHYTSILWMALNFILRFLSSLVKKFVIVGRKEQFWLRLTPY